MILIILKHFYSIISNSTAEQFEWFLIRPLKGVNYIALGKICIIYITIKTTFNFVMTSIKYNLR